MLARLRARGAVPGFRGVRAPGPTLRRPLVAINRGLALRLISGSIAIPLLIGIAYIGNPIYAFFVAAATAYAALEVRGMLRAGGYAPVDWLLVGLAALLPLDVWLFGSSPFIPDPIVVVTALVMLSLASLLIRPTSERALVDWALSLGLALYLGGFMLFYVPLRAVPSSLPGFWVIALMVLSWVCDSSAFFVGGAIGRTPLAPRISPKKSVEGAIAGLIGAAIAGPFLGLAFGEPPALMAGYGLVIGLATIVGDLMESLLKRQTGVKDSGVLIPGHGGLLDRMDSLLVCAPLAVLYLHAVGA
jgi:phosphatidate cytidylyltransferase